MIQFSNFTNSIFSFAVSQILKFYFRFRNSTISILRLDKFNRLALQFRKFSRLISVFAILQFQFYNFKNSTFSFAVSQILTFHFWFRNSTISILQLSKFNRLVLQFRKFSRFIFGFTFDKLNSKKNKIRRYFFLLFSNQLSANVPGLWAGGAMDR